MFLGNPALNWIGTRSYGLYLYHWPIFQIIRGNAGARAHRSRVRRWRWCSRASSPSCRTASSRCRSAGGSSAGGGSGSATSSDPKRQQLIVAVGAVGCVAVFGFAAVSMATAPLKQNEVQEAHRRGAEDVTDVGAIAARATTTVARLPTSTVAPTTSVAPVAIRTRAASRPRHRRPAVGSDDRDRRQLGRYLAIGDSVMPGAASPLKAAGFTVDAVREPPVRRLPRRRCRRSRTAARSPRSSSSTSAPTATSTRTTPATFFDAARRRAQGHRAHELGRSAVDGVEQRADQSLPDRVPERHGRLVGRRWPRSATGELLRRGRRLSTSAPTAPTTTRR